MAQASPDPHGRRIVWHERAFVRIGLRTWYTREIGWNGGCDAIAPAQLRVMVDRCSTPAG
jgi:hypothetical protein